MKRAIGAPRADTKPDLTLDVVLFLALVLLSAILIVWNVPAPPSKHSTVASRS
jgi:hypothetical protein